MATNNVRRHDSLSERARKSNLSNLSDILHDDVDSLKNTVYSMAEKVKKESRKRRNILLEHAKEHPARVLGFGMGLGFILGLLFRK